jgi:16S rRNA processing protein RimM
MKMAADEMVVMGKIAVPYGVQGWVKVQPFTETLDALLDYPTWWIGAQDSWREYSVEECKVHVNTLVAKVAGCADRDLALSLKGKLIAVPRIELPEPDENEYYWSDLIGLEVQNLQQVFFGSVNDVFATGANDVLMVQGDRERLIPFTGQVIKEVDLAHKRILVDWDADF